MPHAENKKRLQTIVDVPLAEAVERAAVRCRLSVSELICAIIRESRPSTISASRFDLGKRYLVLLREGS